MQSNPAERLLVKVAVFVIMRNDNGDILLQQRAGTGYMDGSWDLSASGHVEYGESLAEAAVRELYEELGVTAKPEDMRLMHMYQSYLDTPYINFVFNLSAWQGQPSICEPEKCSDLGYFSPDNLPEHCTRSVRMAASNNFSDELMISKLTPDNYEQIMHEKWI